MNHSNLPFAEVLCCPACKKGELAFIKDNQCVCEACGQTYPIREGVPILIVPGRSVLDPLQLAESEFSLFEAVPRSLIDRLIAKTTRPISRNVAAESNYNRLAADLSRSESESRVLIVGGSVMGAGADKLLNMNSATFIETDVCWGPRTQLICDAHDAPFKSETMDCSGGTSCIGACGRPCALCGGDLSSSQTQRVGLRGDTVSPTRAHGTL